jgi:dTDP-4-amino-4,6-dideoxygalactose transaminase
MGDRSARENEPAAPVLFAVPDLDEDDIAAVVKVLRSGWITTGSECTALESTLAEYLGVAHVVAMSSCTAALETAVYHLGLPPGSRVGVPTWTFVSSALSAVHAGHVPVLIDVDPGTLNLSPNALEAAIDGLDAVIGVHFGGVALDKQIHDLCVEADLPLIEDAAHALGASDHRGLVAGQGTAGACFSFYATKNLTSAEGGALATDDQELADFARSFRLHGMSRDAWARYHPGATAGYDVIGPGIKGNLPDVLAAIARSQFGRFGTMQARRRQLVEQYRARLADVDDLRFVPEQLDVGGADHLLAVLLPPDTDRSSVIAALSGQGISTSVHFQPLHTFGWFEAHAEVGPGGLPVADALAGRELSLPLHSGLTDAEVERVCTALRTALGVPSSPIGADR